MTLLLFYIVSDIQLYTYHSEYFSRIAQSISTSNYLILFCLLLHKNLQCYRQISPLSVNYAIAEKFFKWGNGWRG